MQVWHINLIGISRIRCGEQETRLQAKETWATLAALLVTDAPNKSAGATAPPKWSRQELAERFWGDKLDPRVHLRQSLALLKRTFGADCFLADRDTVQAAPGRFVTDVEQMLTAYRQALASETQDERLDSYARAADYITGDFLQECFDPGDCGENWMLARRAHMRGAFMKILTAYMNALHQADMFPAALEIACRVLEWQPDNREARMLALELADKTGQIAPPFQVETAADSASVIARLRAKPANALTLSERRVFATLFESELNLLPSKYRKPLLRLAVFPGGFSADMAQTVCHVPPAALRVLVKSRLLECDGATFTLLEAARGAAWRQVPATARQRVWKRLAGVCETWLRAARQNFTSPPPPFASCAQARPFLQAAISWHLQQPPTRERIEFLHDVRSLALLDLTAEALPYLERTREDAAFPILLRCQAGCAAGHIHLDGGSADRAACVLGRTVEILASQPDEALAAHLHFLLSLARHYGRNSPDALAHLETAKTYHRHLGDAGGIAQCLRFQSEILNHCGDYQAALIACEEALQIQREARPRSNSTADALFWKGVTIWRLERLREAEACFQEALSIWQENGETTGIAFCLRMLGRARSREGRFAEARAHLEHAILLHERVGDRGSRMAVLEALADNFFAERRFAEARECYAECLADCEAKQLFSRSQDFRARIQECSA